MIFSHDLAIPQSLYIHYPLCRHHCSYCDFNVRSVSQIASKEDFDQNWLDSLKRHLSNWRSGGSLKTLYFGGGTPSLISERVLASLIEELQLFFKWDDQIEVSLEANPEDITEEKLKFLKELGINRLSLGVQSFSGQELRRLERLATLENLEDHLSLVAKHFQNFSFDLMFGIPEQSRESLELSLDRIFSFSPPHVSIYLLTIAEDHKWRRSQKMNSLLANEDQCVAMYEWICERMQREGYRHYEVSNFAKEGFESRHNKNYWNPEKSYLALGPGAHGYCCGAEKIRYENCHSLSEWMKSETGIQGIEILNAEQQKLEEAYLRLRTRMPLSEEGLDPKAVKNFIEAGLVEKYAQDIRVSERSWILLDGIASKLLS
ncbi:MAG: radical SAM family heme chaperone HemW [Bdellovibrionota bacterium]